MPYLITSCNGQSHLGGELGLVLLNQSFRHSLGLTRRRSSASLFPRSCYDNAPIESFLGEKHCFARKNELVYHKIYETRQQAIVDVTRYIEIFYNRQRIQKGLGFKSPARVSRSFIVRLPDIIYQVFYYVVDSRGQSKVCR